MHLVNFTTFSWWRLRKIKMNVVYFIASQKTKEIKRQCQWVMPYFMECRVCISCDGKYWTIYRPMRTYSWGHSWPIKKISRFGWVASSEQKRKPWFAHSSIYSSQELLTFLSSFSKIKIEYLALSLKGHDKDYFFSRLALLSCTAFHI